MAAGTTCCTLSFTSLGPHPPRDTLQEDLVPCNVDIELVDEKCTSLNRSLVYKIHLPSSPTHCITVNNSTIKPLRIRYVFLSNYSLCASVPPSQFRWNFAWSFCLKLGRFLNTNRSLETLRLRYNGFINYQLNFADKLSLLSCHGKLFLTKIHGKSYAIKVEPVHLVLNNHHSCGDVI